MENWSQVLLPIINLDVDELMYYKFTTCNAIYMQPIVFFCPVSSKSEKYNFL